MRKLLLLSLLIPFQAFAMAPECPAYDNKRECMHSVDESYNNFLKEIEEEYKKNQQPELIQAANDVKHFEILACKRTCLN
ncbi:MAG: hypothetical protein KA112_01435 [Alphaproteobacteria bacterium]|jgi:hypothetical protein|nr:hypothetical protein [Alphaproteobacteria bacterium]MBP7729263.1 hypothetical protein [Alphaproteobacteria bacterium]